MTLSMPVAPVRDQAVASLLDIAFWRKLCPMLSVSADLSPPAPTNGGAVPCQRTRDRMRTEGYFQEHDSDLASLAPLVGQAVAQLVAAGIPPAFVFVFDEAWACFHRLHGVIVDLLGPEYRVLPDFWAWHVDPASEQSGWRPHRDKGSKSLAADGSPLSLTIWIPLSEATPLNGCMYVLPANRDPVYGTPDDETPQIDLPSIRALPAGPGEFICWNQAVLHWGARSSRFGEKPRISMALEFQRGDVAPFNQPLLPPLTTFSFEDRLQLIAKQILQYQHMYPLPPALEVFAQSMLPGHTA